MVFQGDVGTIQWRLHLASPPAVVFDALATDEGRARFWAESAIERDGQIRFVFLNGIECTGTVRSKVSGELFAVSYFGSEATFRLVGDGTGGTDLTLTDVGVSEQDRFEVTAGWVSVLMALKAWVDHGIDLRNHDPARTWSQGYADN